MLKTALLVTLLTPAAALAAPVYIALGDSITRGETDLNYVPSYGDMGYVAKVADALAAKNGGTRPTVINLAIDGETASSFNTGMGRTPPVQGRTDVPLALENLNYAGQAATPQHDLLAAKIAQQTAMGNTIADVSITLGFNELGAIATKPNALALLPGVLGAYLANETKNLSFIRSLAPNANLYLVNYYNPFPGDPGNPAGSFFATAGPKLDAIIKALAGEFHAYYVDTATPFKGHEAAYTYIAQQSAGFYRDGRYSGIEPIGNVHPNDTGYGVIAAQFRSATIPTPEPAIMGLFGIGMGIVLARRARLQPRRLRGWDPRPLS